MTLAHETRAASCLALRSKSLALEPLSLEDRLPTFANDNRARAVVIDGGLAFAFLSVQWLEFGGDFLRRWRSTPEAQAKTHGGTWGLCGDLSSATFYGLARPLFKRVRMKTNADRGRRSMQHKTSPPRKEDFQWCTADEDIGRTQRRSVTSRRRNRTSRRGR